MACPTPERLEEVLRSGQFAEELYAHVERCDACLQLLESLSEGSKRELPSSTEGNASITRAEDLEFLRRLADEAKRPESTHDDDVTLVFPGAPTAIGHLGTIDRYEVIERVDGGGFGQVFRARDTQLDRTVALKLLPVSRFEAVSKERFRREAQAAGAVQHENVVVLHQVLEPTPAFRYACLVMEFMSGGSLKRRLESNEVIDIRQIVRWVIEAAKGLTAVHTAGMLHRDIKPGNLLLNEHNRLKIGDFGLARALVRDDEFSRDIVGTPAYMSPEQLVTPDQLTVQSDIYGLGVVFYQLLTGERPFQGRDEVLRKQIIEAAPASVRKLNPRVSRDLETICLRCLHKQPERRFESSAALADDLQNWYDGRPIVSRRIGLWERAYWWVKRRPALATAFTSAIVIAVVASLAAFESERLRRDAEINRQRAEASQQVVLELQADTIETVSKQLGFLSGRLGDKVALASVYELLSSRLNGLALPEVDAQPWDQLEKDKAITLARINLQLGTICSTLAATQQSPDLPKQSADYFNVAIELFEQLGDDYESELNGAYDGLAALALQQGDTATAEAIFMGLRERCEQRLIESPDDAQLQRELSVYLESLASIEKQKANNAARMEFLQECLALREKALARNSDDHQTQHEIANVLVQLGETVLATEPEVAIGYYARAIELSEKAVASQPQNFGYLRTLANAFDRLGSAVALPDEKLEWKRKALAIRERIARLDPQGRSTVRDLIVSYLGLVANTDDQELVKQYLDLAGERAEVWWGVDPTDLEAIQMLSRTELGYCDWYSNRNEYETALRHAQRAVELRRGLVERAPIAASKRSLFVALNTLGDLYLEQLDSLEAARLILEEQVAIADSMIQAEENAEIMVSWRDEIIEKMKKNGLR